MKRNVNSLMRLMLLATVVLCSAMPVKSQNRFAPDEHRLQVGLVLDPTVLRHLSFSGNGVKPALPNALVIKRLCNAANAFTVFVAYGASDGLSNYNPERRYLFTGFNLHVSYEHAFFAERRFNLLTGAKLGYIYSRDVLPDFHFSNVRYPEMLKFHSRLGPGADIGVRFNATKRFGLESNFGVTYTWPMPYNESFKSWSRKGYLATHRAVSIDVYYRF